ncbi:fungal fruit body lectin [Immersiella caudata]|uniref:Fungal fruit body lectin n=1 Tax=Immersiella caudata TaxID=314043 RepID=A0AA39WLH8_9PEZI|nr:fungal fruit body lectin [Immersiella caudata]
MSYRVSLRLINDTNVTLTIIEKTCWKGAGTAWTQSESGHHLSMNSSGSSGMLRLRSSEGEYFSVAVGVHNYKRWCDVDVNLSDSQVLTGLHPQYYNEKDAKYQALWAQATEKEGVSEKKRKWRVEFYQAEGNELRGNLVFA